MSKSRGFASRRAAAAAVVLALVTCAAGQDQLPAATPRFVDVAAEAGLRTVIHCGGRDKDHILESVGSGVALVDTDRDGRLDAYLVNAWELSEEPSGVARKGRNALYRNVGGGRFEDVSRAAGVDDDGWGCGVCAGDYDNDGYTDLYVTNFGPNVLLRNRGDGTFEDVSLRAGVADPGWGAGAAFFDADLDGDLDLYVANYIDCTMEDVLAARRSRKWRDLVKVMSGPFGMRGGRDRFFRNNGDGTFADATEEAGMTDRAEGYGLGVLASDLDNDGDVDLYVANDSNANLLYRNDGGGKFTDVGLWCGAAYNAAGVAQAGMGVDAGDLDGDGLQEILVTNFARDYCTLYRNSGGLFFEDVSGKYQLERFTYEALSWGCTFFDFDRDADLDVLIVNGHIYPQVDDEPKLDERYRQLPTLLRYERGRFEEVGRTAGPGMQAPLSARGLAVGDIDDDGDLDLLISGIDAPPQLLRNDTAATGHWVKLRLRNRHGSDALNARATVRIGDATLLREVRSGSTYASQSAFDLHFGLAGHARIDVLTVHWPSGRKTELRDLAADRTIVLDEPE